MPSSVAWGGRTGSPPRKVASRPGSAGTSIVRLIVSSAGPEPDAGTGVPPGRLRPRSVIVVVSPGWTAAGITASRCGTLPIWSR